MMKRVWFEHNLPIMTLHRNRPRFIYVSVVFDDDHIYDIDELRAFRRVINRLVRELVQFKKWSLEAVAYMVSIQFPMASEVVVRAMFNKHKVQILGQPNDV